MTAIERLKELESYSLKPFTRVPERWRLRSPGALPMEIAEDFDFLRKSFNVLFNLAKEKLEDDCGWLGDLEKEFESRMSR